MTQLLEVQDLTKRFGGLTAVSEVSFSVNKGEIFGIIGPNGAGKTTLFNVIAGHYRPSAGKVVFAGTDITAHSSDEIGRRGIARTFQAVHLFKKETVRENLRRAEIISRWHHPFALFARPASTAKIDLEDVARFVGLGDLLDVVAGGLSYGFQKILGIGMAMMVSPKLILMDEPAAGLNPSEKKEASRLVRRLRDERNISILIVEHDMPLVMDICDRILVVSQGKRIALATPDLIKADAKVIDAYLGENYEFA
jgi:branched-chain amino acid transport system ATP-binding protein